MVVRPWIEVRDAAIYWVQPADKEAHSRATTPTTERLETASNQNLSICLHHDGADNAIRPRIEVREAAISVQLADAAAPTRALSATTELGESASNQNILIHLHYDCADRAAARSWIEVWVEDAIFSESADEPARVTTEHGELASDQNISIRLHCYGEDFAVRPWIEAQVEVEAVIF